MRAANLSNKQFGKLKVIESLGSEKGRKIWLCVCDCGKSTIVPTIRLTKGQTTSCGCYRPRLLSGDEGSFRESYRNYRDNARNRNYIFDLTPEQYRNISSKPCYYCGAIPKPVLGKNRKSTPIPYICNGLDRLNNSLGYSLVNCVPCCTICNFMKGTLSAENFVEQVKHICNHLWGKREK